MPFILCCVGVRVASLGPSGLCGCLLVLRLAGGLLGLLGLLLSLACSRGPGWSPLCLCGTGCVGGLAAVGGLGRGVAGCLLSGLACVCLACSVRLLRLHHGDVEVGEQGLQVLQYLGGKEEREEGRKQGRKKDMMPVNGEAWTGASCV